MLNSQQKSSKWLSFLRKHKHDANDGISIRVISPSHYMIFFTLFYLYLWLYVDMRLIYHGAGVITNFPVFYKGRAFFQTFLSYPGGPIEYISAFLSQLFYYSWAGALIVTIQALLLSACVAYLLKATKFPRVRLICFVLPVVMLIIYNQYTYFFPTTMALLTAMIFTCLYLKVTSQCTRIISYIGTFLLLSLILYYLAGGAFLIFAVICAIYELLFRSRLKAGLFYLLCTAGIPYVVGLLIFRVSIVDAFCNSLPFSWKILYFETRRRGVTIVYVLFSLPPVILLVLGLWHTFEKILHLIKNRAGKKPPKKQKEKSPNPIIKVFSWYRHSPKLNWAIELLLLLLITGSTIYLSRNDNLRTQLKVDYFAYHKMWPELIESARGNPTNPFVTHAVNRALYHTGRLGDEMFFWPQNPDYLFLTSTKYKWHYWQNFDAYLDIGFINMAENGLTECLEGLGDRPMILQRLALVNMVKANTDTARIYLNKLNKTFFHADWAEHYLKLLQTDPNLSSDAYIQQLRAFALQKDHCALSIPIHTMLTFLLEDNSENKMAFEYLMAWYMLNKHLGNVIQNIERLKDFGYSRIPTHYEEASLVYVAGTGKKIRISGYKASNTLRQRIEDFSRILKSYGANKQAAFNELASKHRNTYFFYFLYAPSGAKE